MQYGPGPTTLLSEEFGYGGRGRGRRCPHCDDRSRSWRTAPAHFQHAKDGRAPTQNRERPLLPPMGIRFFNVALRAAIRQLRNNRRFKAKIYVVDAFTELSHREHC
jgi:hypothetical protein